MTLLRRMPGWLLLLLVAAGPAPDSPEACALLSRGALGVTFHGNQPLVQVAIDGTMVTLLLDTGAERSLLSTAAMQRLRLPEDPARSTTLRGIGGSSTHRNAVVRRLQIGGNVLADQSLAVAPFALRGFPVPVDGLLGGDVLANFDVDFNLARAEVLLYRARNCVGAMPAWHDPPALKADIGRGPGRNLLYLPIVIDGRTLLALIDTGADTGADLGAIDRAAAAAVGATGEALRDAGRLVVHGAAPVDAVARRHRFGSAAIGLDNIAHPGMLVVDLPAGSGDVLIGVGFARTHRLWVSYASRRMFIGYAGR